MDITVRGKHFDVPDGVEQRARRKLAKLDHYLPLLRDGTVEIDIAHERAKQPDNRYLVRVLVDGGGVRLRAEERAKELSKAIDTAARVLIDQARKHKERLYGRSRARAPKEALLAAAPAAIAPPEETPWERLVRVKRFDVKPMTVREAADEMELLGHSFFVFHHAAEDRFAVLYRRTNGDYGVILPELS